MFYPLKGMLLYLKTYAFENLKLFFRYFIPIFSLDWKCYLSGKEKSKYVIKG